MGQTCGAKTRSGAPCKKAPKKGRTRCRLHGGATPKGQRNNVKHGIYAAYLTEDEKVAWQSLELGKVDDELRLCRIQLMRALKAQNESNPREPELVEIVARKAEGDSPAYGEKRYKRLDYQPIIDRLLGRIESLERTRAELMKTGDDDGEIEAVSVTIERRSARKLNDAGTE